MSIEDLMNYVVSDLLDICFGSNFHCGERHKITKNRLKPEVDNKFMCGCTGCVDCRL